MNYMKDVEEFLHGELKAFEKIEDNYLKAEQLPKLIGYYQLAKLFRGETFIQENDLDYLKSGNRDIENKVIKTIDNFFKEESVKKQMEEEVGFKRFVKQTLVGVNERWLNMMIN